MAKKGEKVLYPMDGSVQEPHHAPARELTSGRAWKFRRNLVIVIAYNAGVSQRVLADVFDLPHSRIAAIVKEFRGRFGDRRP